MRSFIEELDIKDYGDIQVKIKEYCKKNNIKKSQFITALNCGYSVGNRYYENKCKKVDIDILSRILYILECDNILDIIEYKKPTK